MKTTSSLLLRLEPLSTQQLRYRWLVELAWIVLSLLVIVVLLYRFMPEFKSNAFFWPVLVGFLATGTYGRYLLNLSATPWARSVVTILLLGLACVPVGVFLYMRFTEFQVYFDGTGFEDLYAGRPFLESIELKKDLRNICIISFVSGLVSIVLYPLSGVRYLWKKYKINT